MTGLLQQHHKISATLKLLNTSWCHLLELIVDINDASETDVLTKLLEQILKTKMS